jgi:IS30 family transposase
MGRHYGQLGLEERIEIYRLHAGGKSQAAIAALLGRARSTISRELKRNSVRTKVWRGGYDPVRAQRLSERRRRWDCRFKLERQPDLRERVRDGLAMGWSPEQIAGRLTREHGRTLISHESIYRFVYHRSAQKDYWHRLLPRAKHRRGHRARPGGSMVDIIKGRKSLAERPAQADDRCTPGHWEADFMLFARSGQALLIVHERASRFTLIQHLPDRKARRTATAIAAMLEPMSQPMRQSMTFDNGPEFAMHHQIGIDPFFCDVRSPWQKGGIENAIGRLRHTLPRKTNLENLDPSHIHHAAQRYNNTPRKCLDFLTPAEACSRCQSSVALQS